MGIINIFISTVLALIYPGAGQIYNGQTKKGFWFFGIGVTLWLLSETILTRLWFEWIIGLYQLGTVIDAVVVAIGIYRGKKDLTFVRNWKGFVKIAIVIVVPFCLMFPFLHRLFHLHSQTFFLHLRNVLVRFIQILSETQLLFWRVHHHVCLSQYLLHVWFVLDKFQIDLGIGQRMLKFLPI